MKNDFVLSESEISIAVNKITKHAEFLAQSIDTYITILSEIQNKGIKDKLICGELSNLAADAKRNQDSIVKVYEKLNLYIKAELDEVESGDYFKFPSDFMVEITSLLSKFF